MQEITEQEASYVWTDIHKYTEEKNRISEELALREMENRKIKKTVWLIQKKFPNGEFHPMELIVFVLLIISPLFIVSKTVELSDGDHHFLMLPDLYLESDESK